MMRLSVLLLSAVLLEMSLVTPAFEIPAKTTQYPDGRIILPRSDVNSSEGSSFVWAYKPSRWGMYEIALVYSPDTAAPRDLQIEIAGQKFKDTGGVREAFEEFILFPMGRFYLVKSAPFEVRVANSGNIEKLRAVLLRPAPEGKPIVQNSDQIILHARDATTHSVMMRYEPATNKNCLGYWTNPNDTASWTFEVTKPGVYEIELWQGCGKGQGGSTVAVRVDDPRQTAASSASAVLRETTFVVEDTGHFQNFAPRNLGAVTFSQKGKYVLSVRPENKKAAAVMDIRQIVLKPGKPDDQAVPKG
jgi:hypothetical protein